MYGDSRALAADPTAIFSPNSRPKGDRKLVLSNNPEMNSHQNEYNSSSTSGLLRFRSAPSSVLSDFANGDDKGLMSNRFSTHLASQTLAKVQGMEEESKPLANGYSLMSSQLPPQYPRQSSSSTTTTTQLAGSSNLMRQSSSPAGLFSHFTPQNGYAALRGFGNDRVGNGTNGDVSPSSSRFRGLVNFSSGVPSSFGVLSQISEIESEGVGGNCHEDIKLGNGSRDSQFYSPGYAFGSWNDSSHFQENFSVLKRDLDNHDCKLFAGVQNVELENRTRSLSHHLSLPKSVGDMAEMEKLLQFQDTVPCKVRAKRGCATHPRSIAERVRRTRISERMRKLQELVPNMDKQTNTAEMLDLAVEYIKDLQKQYKTLSENRANCKCSSMQKPFPNLSA